MTRIDIGGSLKRHAIHFPWKILDDVLGRLSEGRRVDSRKKAMADFFGEDDLSSPDLKAYFSMLRQFHREDAGTGIFCAPLERVRTWVSLHEVFVSARWKSPVVKKCVLYCHDHLFDYGQFSAGKCLAVCANGKLYWKSAGGWGAAELIRETGFATCAYCNANAVETDDMRHSPLDHYYPRDRFPFLALTLSNLIPVCERCNEIKQQAVFNAWTHANPMDDDLHELLRFDVQGLNQRVFSGLPRKGDLELSLNARIPKGRGIAALRLLNDLRVEKRYREFHWRKAADLISFLHDLDSARVDTLKGFNAGIVSLANIRSCIGLTPDPMLIKSESLLKMKIDIFDRYRSELSVAV